jgi:hypothetical protein
MNPPTRRESGPASPTLQITRNGNQDQRTRACLRDPSPLTATSWRASREAFAAVRCLVPPDNAAELGRTFLSRFDGDVDAAVGTLVALVLEVAA